MDEQKIDYSKVNRMRIDRRDLVELLSKFEGRDIDIRTLQYPDGRVALEINNPKRPQDPTMIIFDRTMPPPD